MASFNNPDQALAKFVKDQGALERALAPGRSMADIVKAFQPPALSAPLAELAKAIQPPLTVSSAFAQIAASMTPPTHLTAVAQMVKAIDATQGRFAAMISTALTAHDLADQFAGMRGVVEQITAANSAIGAMLRSQSSIVGDVVARVADLEAIKISIPQISESSLAWSVASVGLANRLRDIGLIDQREALSVRLFAGTEAYAKFLRDTSELIAAGSAGKSVVPLRASLRLAENQLVGMVDALSEFVDVPDDNDAPAEIVLLDAPYRQREELISQGSIVDEADPSVLTARSTTAQNVERTRSMLTLLTQCNEAAKTSAVGQELFKPTTKLLIAFTDLPWLSATDRTKLADIIDDLYFIFYEGAGKDNLHFLNENGGPLTEADCDFIWCVKHLRNKWTRHDADHGGEKSIRKSWDELAAKFRWLGLAEHPTEPEHFQLLHSRLLESAVEFLRLILGKLKLKS